MKTQRLYYTIFFMSRMLKVSDSGYYAWLKRPPSKRAQEEKRLEIEIKAAHERSRGTFGTERLQKELLNHSIKVGISRIRRIRKNLGISCKQVKKFKATTDSRHTFPVAENILGQRFEATMPDEIWASDITYVHTDEGWLYIAAHKDLHTSEIVGYAIDSRITKELIMRSLYRAVSMRKPPEGLIHHSDRGSQYCSKEYQKLLNQFNMRVSMSRKGNCYDNAPMESFWGTIKNELIYHRKYKTRKEAMRDIIEYPQR